jgi:Ni/Co efflux regulator RcnB
MKIKAVVSTIIAVSLTPGGFAFADGNGDHHDRDRNEQAQHGNQQDRHDGHGNEGRGERGAGPNHAFHRGVRLPVEYRNRQYVVDDFPTSRLQLGSNRRRLCTGSDCQRRHSAAFAD